MNTFLLQVKQHFRDGILHKNEFKIVYVAPMKVLFSLTLPLMFGCFGNHWILHTHKILFRPWPQR
jgi:hypothetical protein